MRKTLIILIYLIQFSFTSFAQNSDAILGYWSGKFEKGNFQLSMSVEFSNENGLKGFFSSQDQRAMDIPLQNIKCENNKVHFELVGDVNSFVFDGNVDDNKMGVTLNTQGDTGKFILYKSDKPKINYDKEEVVFKNGDVELSGTLYLPKGDDVVPAIVLNHGSGAETRFAGVYLADFFANRHIAALVYDKRGTGKSTGDWKTSDFNDLAEDCIAAIQFLKNHKRIAPSKIGIYGHSQGGSISPLIISKCNDIAFSISVAAMGCSIPEQDIYRVKNILKHTDLNEEEINNAMGFFELWLNVAAIGDGWDTLESAKTKFKNEKWFGYVQPPPKGSWVWNFYKKISQYNSLEYWKEVKIPVLLVFGENDENTPPNSSIKSISKIMDENKNTKFTSVILPNTSHEIHLNEKIDFPWFKATPGYPEMLYKWVSKVVSE